METPALPPVTHTNPLARFGGVMAIIAVAVSLVSVAVSLFIPTMWLVTPFFCGISLLMGILALIFGSVALGQMKKYPGQGGRKMALTAVIIGIFSVLALCLLPFALLLIGPAIDNLISTYYATPFAP